MTRHTLLYLDHDKRFRIVTDGLQWILERRSRRERPGKDSGYRGVAHVRSTKEILMRCIREKGCPLTPEAEALLRELPATHEECRRLMEELGVELFRATLLERAGLVEAPHRRVDPRERSDSCGPALAVTPDGMASLRSLAGGGVVPH